MTEKQANFLKVIFVVLISAITIFFLGLQDYIGTVSVLTWASIIGMTIWGAAYSYKNVPLGKFIIIALMAMLVGFLTEFVGSQEGLWDFGAYNPPYYIVTGWVLLVLTILLLTDLTYESKFIPAVPTSRYDPYIGALIPVLLLAFLLGTLGEYRTPAGSLFFAYYGVLTVVNAVYYFRYPDTKKLLLAVVAAWIVGAFTEVIGAESNLWEFTYGFPVWIVISGWSLEWLFILAGSNFIKSMIQKNEA